MSSKEKRFERLALQQETLAMPTRTSVRNLSQAILMQEQQSPKKSIDGTQQEVVPVRTQSSASIESVESMVARIKSEPNSPRRVIRQEVHKLQQELDLLSFERVVDDNALFCTKRFSKPEVSLFERYFEDPEELDCVALGHLNRRFLDLCRGKGTIHQIDRLLAQGADGHNIFDESGNSPLHLAARAGNAKLTRHLMKKGLDTEATNRLGFKPVDIAAENTTKVFFEPHRKKLFESATVDAVKVVQSLIAFLQENGVFEPMLPIMLLHVAAEHGSALVTQYMLDVFGVPVDATTGVGRTALHYAVVANQYEIIRLLLERGADTELADMRGRKPHEETSDRITQRILQHSQSTRLNSVSESQYLEKFGDYFATSRELVESVFLVGFGIDQSRLSEIDECIENGELLEVVGTHKTDQLNRYIVFCKEAMKNSLATAEVETKEHTKQMSIDYSFAAKGAFVLLRPEKVDSSMGRRDSEISELASPNHMMTGKMQQRLRVNVSLFFPSFYPFVVTSNEGARSYCCLVTFIQLRKDSSTSPLEAGEAGQLLEGRCLCLTSKLPLFHLHRNFLLDVFSVGMGYWRANKFLNVPNQVSSLVGQQIGLPGDEGVAIDIGTRYLTYTAPPVALPVVDDICFHTLLRALTPDKIVQVYTAMLIELPILFVSEHTALLTLATQALLALIFPFEWYHPYIPVLPSSMLQIVEAPFPFLIGIHTSDFGNVSVDRLSSIMIVNLDSSSVVLPIDLPPQFLTVLGHDKEKLEIPQLSNFLQTSMESEILEALPVGKFLPRAKVVMKSFCCPGHWSIGEDEMSEPSQIFDSTTSFHTGTGDRGGRHESFSSHGRSPKKSSMGSFFKLRSDTRTRPWIGALEAGIIQIRKTCLQTICKVIGEYGSCMFAPEEKGKFISKQDNEIRPFISALLSTQLWASFVKELRDGARTQEREKQLQFFSLFLDQHMQNEILMVHSLKVFLRSEPLQTAPVVTVLQKGDLVTVIDEVTLPSKHVWVRFREHNGWCYTRKNDDFKSRPRPRNKRLHYPNDMIYPKLEHGNQISQDYFALFSEVEFEASFPGLR